VWENSGLSNHVERLRDLSNDIIAALLLYQFFDDPMDSLHNSS
jgi:hypothetical protein